MSRSPCSSGYRVGLYVGARPRALFKAPISAEYGAANGLTHPLLDTVGAAQPTAFVVIVTNATHGVTSHSLCAARAARDFLRDPTKPVDQSCLPAADTPLVFIES